MTKIEWSVTELDSRRFDVKYRKTDGCWLWSAGHNPDGYGKFWWGGQTINAHVFAFVRDQGYRPPVVRHSCNARNCVNPAHLLGGTVHDNNLDTRACGHQPRAQRIKSITRPRKRNYGARNGRAVLAETQVVEIRQRYAEEDRTSHRLLAARYGVSKSLIQRIIQGHVWSYL